MKAQASVEFLFNFLAMLAVLSILLAGLSGYLSAAESHRDAVYEKAKIEEFARALDAAECMRNARFLSEGNYSAGSIDYEGAITGEAGGQAITGYTIYGMGGNHGEPI